MEDASPRRHRNYSAERDRQKLVRECAVVQEILPAVFPDLAEKLAAVKSEVHEGAGLHTLEPAALAERRAAEQYAKRKAKRLELYQHALLQPVRSYESAVVVRWTIRLSAWLNNKYGPSPWMQPAPQSAKNAVLGADATGPPSQCPFAMCQDGDRLRLFVSQDEEVVVDEVEQTPSGLRLAGALAERAGGWQWADQARVTYFADVLELVTFYSQFPYDGTHTLLVPPPVSPPGAWSLGTLGLRCGVYKRPVAYCSCVRACSRATHNLAPPLTHTTPPLSPLAHLRAEAWPPSWRARCSR